jgi:hypothetical protein
MANPTLNDLRILATALPPSERVFGGEAADIVSAIAAVIQHGPTIIKAAEDGNIGDFFHDLAIASAEERGVEAPVRGATAPAPAPTAAPVSAAAIDYNKLADLIAARMLQDSQATAPAPAAPPLTVPPAGVPTDSVGGLAFPTPPAPVTPAAPPTDTSNPPA